MLWKKETRGNRLAYELISNEKMIARIVFDTNKSYHEATCIVDGSLYKVSRSGFWKTKIHFVNERDDLIATIDQERMQSRKWRIHFLNKIYHIHYHNNPLFELVIYDEQFSYLITYKLNVADEHYSADVEIHNVAFQFSEKNLLLIIGWYLFMPIAHENTLAYAS